MTSTEDRKILKKVSTKIKKIIKTDVDKIENNIIRSTLSETFEHVAAMLISAGDEPVADSSEVAIDEEG